MENILVCDNFLTKEELDTANNIIANNKWIYGHISGSKDIETPVWKMDLMENTFFSLTIKNAIERCFSKKLKLLRVYANGQTFGQDGGFHKDDDNKDRYTFCLYLSNIKNEYLDTAGGYITFKIPDKKYNISYDLQ
jgi:hypothetical protein